MMRPIVIPVILVLLAMPALASIDLISPSDGLHTRNATITFDYHVRMPALDSCVLAAGKFTFPDPDPENGTINSIVVQNIGEGVHSWNISCIGLAQESSAGRTLVIDRTPPSLVLHAPTQDASVSRLEVSFTPTDSRSQEMSCAIIWQGQNVGSAIVANGTRHTAEYPAGHGTGSLVVQCKDAAGNTVEKTRAVTVEPDLILSLATEQDSYGLTDPVRLFIDTFDGADVIIDICPNKQGFVACATALMNGTEFPQTITLPYMNKTGEYLVEATVRHGSVVLVNTTIYTIENTLSAHISIDDEPRVNRTVELSANVGGGIAPYGLSWTLSNGTIIKDHSKVEVRYDEPGNYTETLVVTDAAGNTLQKQFVLLVPRIYVLSVEVLDDLTGAPVPNALVGLTDQESTAINGLTEFLLPEGDHKVFVTAAGYEYGIAKVDLTKNAKVVVRLTPQKDRPIVEILSPSGDAASQGSIEVRYSLQYDRQAICTLYLGVEGGWFIENGTQKVTGGTHAFRTSLEEGTHRLKVECSDDAGVSGSSLVHEITAGVAGAPQQGPSPQQSSSPASEEFLLQDELQRINGLIGAIDTYGPDTRRVAEVLGFDKQLRSAKRSVQQAIRDIDSLRYREDLSDEQRAAERTDILNRLEGTIRKVPESLSVIDKREYVRYLEEDDSISVAELLVRLGESTVKPSKLAKLLMEDQQKFTVVSEAYHIQYSYKDSESTATLVTRRFTYADDLSREYGVIEIIPKEIVDDAAKIDLITEADILERDPVLKFPAEEMIAYVLPKKVDFTTMERMHTVLAKPYLDTGIITGFAVFDAGGSIGMPVMILAGILLLGYLAFRIDLVGKARFVAYRFGRKEEVRYLKVLVTDALDNLSADNYGKAEMLYKEIRLTYDRLSVPARNDLYEDVMELVHRMDDYYFSLIMKDLDESIREGDLASAISAYEKLTGTFHRLDPGRQAQLVATVEDIAKRIGIGGTV